MCRGHEGSEENTLPASQRHGWIDVSAHYQRTAAVTITPHQPLPQIPDWYQNYTPLQQQPSSLWMDQAFVFLIHLVIALVLAKQKKEKQKRKGGGKTYITFSCIRAWGFQLLIKTLTFGPVGLCAWFMGYRGPWSHLSVCGVCGWGYGVCTFGSVHYMFAL